MRESALVEAIVHMAFAYALGVAIKSIFTSQGVNARAVSESCYCCISERVISYVIQYPMVQIPGVLEAL